MFTVCSLQGLCFRNGQFWLVAVVYGVALGVVNCWSSVLDVNLAPLGVGETEAGWIGFYATCSGCIASIGVARWRSPATARNLTQHHYTGSNLTQHSTRAATSQQHHYTGSNLTATPVHGQQPHSNTITRAATSRNTITRAATPLHGQQHQYTGSNLTQHHYTGSNTSTRAATSRNTITRAATSRNTITRAATPLHGQQPHATPVHGQQPHSNTITWAATSRNTITRAATSRNTITRAATSQQHHCTGSNLTATPLHEQQPHSNSITRVERRTCWPQLPVPTNKSLILILYSPRKCYSCGKRSSISIYPLVCVCLGVCLYVWVCVCMFVCVCLWTVTYVQTVVVKDSLAANWTESYGSSNWSLIGLFPIPVTSVLHNWCNKGHGMCYSFCRMVHIKDPFVLFGKNSPWIWGSRYLFSLSLSSLFICLKP